MVPKSLSPESSGGDNLENRLLYRMITRGCRKPREKTTHSSQALDKGRGGANHQKERHLLSWALKGYLRWALIRKRKSLRELDQGKAVLVAAAWTRGEEQGRLSLGGTRRNTMGQSPA